MKPLTLQHVPNLRNAPVVVILVLRTQRCSVYKVSQSPSRLQDNPLIQRDERKCRFYALLRVAACQKIDPSAQYARKREKREREKVSISETQTHIHGHNENVCATAIHKSTPLVEINAKTYIDRYTYFFYDDKEGIFGGRYNSLCTLKYEDKEIQKKTDKNQKRLIFCYAK